MRVIAGQYRSRPLRSMPGTDLRPTADRLRETLFNVLTAGNPEALAGTVWIDLYAGTGAVGIEALSRGAGMVYFVENSLPTAGLIEKNLKSLDVSAGFEILKVEAAAGLQRLESKAVAPDFIFLDPPYRLEKEYQKTLELLGSSSLAGNAVVIAEHEKRFDPGERFGSLTRSRKLVQSDAALSFYRKVPG